MTVLPRFVRPVLCFKVSRIYNESRNLTVSILKEPGSFVLRVFNPSLRSFFRGFSNLFFINIYEYLNIVIQTKSSEYVVRGVVWCGLNIVLDLISRIKYFWFGSDWIIWDRFIQIEHPFVSKFTIKYQNFQINLFNVINQNQNHKNKKPSQELSKANSSS